MSIGKFIDIFFVYVKKNEERKRTRVKRKK